MSDRQGTIRSRAAQRGALTRLDPRGCGIIGVMLLIPCCLTGCAGAPTCRVAAGLEDGRRGDSGCVIIDDASLLVIRHRLGGKLGLPGGAAAAGESAQCTAHRETWEETGLDVRVGRFLGRLDTGFPGLPMRCRCLAGPGTGAGSAARGAVRSERNRLGPSG